MKLPLSFLARAFAFTVSFLSISAFALQLSPKRDGVSLLEKPANGAGVITQLKTTDRVEVHSRSGMYWTVMFNGKKGYVPASEMQTAGGSGVSGAVKSAITKKNDTSNGSRTRANAVMGIRGLDDSESSLSEATMAKPNTHAAKKMEERHVSPEGVSEIEKSVNAEIEKKSKDHAK